jgi:hypothetical protein
MRRYHWSDRRRRWALAGVGAAALVALMAPAMPAAAQSEGPLVRITFNDPFTRCTADNVTQQEQTLGSTLYPFTAIEPWVAADPTDTDHLLVGHQQDRWSDGGARGNIGNLSEDGGKTWEQTIPAEVTACAKGSFLRASDPWVDFSPDGTAYYLSLVIDPANNFFGASSGAMLVNRSRSHGEHWGEPITLITDGPDALNDKDSLTADPKDSDFAYAVWDRLQIVTAAAASSVAAPQAASPSSGFRGDGVAIGRARVQRLLAKHHLAAAATPAQATPDTRGPSMFSRTTNGGDSWETPRVIYDPGLNAQTIDNLVVVLPNGDVLDFFTNITADGALSIGYVRSKDKGATFDPTPTFATDIQVVGTVTPDALEAVRDAAILYAVTVDRKSGAIYIAWQDCRFGPNDCTSATPVDSIAFIQSLDGGATWSTPIPINQTPQHLSNPLRQQAFIPAIAVGSDHTIAVTYYDFRNDVSTAGLELTDSWIAFCEAEGPTACPNEGNWGNELRLSDTSFNMLDAPEAGGHFLGDYMGLVASGRHVHPVFGMTTGVNQTADFTRKIRLPHEPEVAEE